MNKHPIIYIIVAIVGIIGTTFAMSDRFIARATFMEFKEFVVYRLDSIDEKLNILIREKGQ